MPGVVAAYSGQDMVTAAPNLTRPASQRAGLGSRVYGPSLLYTSGVVYDFSGGSLPASINNPAMSYGGFGQTAGRGYVDVSTTYAGLYSPNVYTFDDFYFDAFPAVANGATTEAYSSFWLDTQTQAAGTTIGFFYDGINDQLYCSNWVNYADASGGETILSNARVAHPKWRITRSGGNFLWRTSVDGITWTTQRTIAIPAWVTGSNLAVWWEAHRGEGTANQFQFDNINIPVSTGTTYDLTGSASVTPSSEGTLSTLLGLAGASSVVPVSAGSVILTGDLTGSASVTPSAAGAISSLLQVAGASFVTPSSSGALLRLTPISGASSVNPSTAGFLTATGALSGAGAVTPSASGSLIRVTPITGSSSVSPSASGSLTVQAGAVVYSLSGAAAVNPVSAGSVIARLVLSGASSVAPASAGLLTSAVALTGSASVVPASAGSIDLLGVLPLSGASVVNPVSAGSLSIRGGLSGASLTNPTATGSLSARLALSGASSVAPSAAGSLAVSGPAPILIAGASSVTPVATGVLRHILRLTGASSVTPMASGSAFLRQLLSGAAVTVPTAYGTITLIGPVPGVTPRPYAGRTLYSGGIITEHGHSVRTYPIAGGTTSRPYAGRTA